MLFSVKSACTPYFFIAILRSFADSQAKYLPYVENGEGSLWHTKLKDGLILGIGTACFNEHIRMDFDKWDAPLTLSYGVSGKMGYTFECENGCKNTGIQNQDKVSLDISQNGEVRQIFSQNGSLSLLIPYCCIPLLM